MLINVHKTPMNFLLEVALEMYNLLFFLIEMHDLLVLISSIIGLCFFLCKTNKSMLNSI